VIWSGTRCPFLSTTTDTGVAAGQPSVCCPAHLWEPIRLRNLSARSVPLTSASDWPSIEITLSPGWSAPLAGESWVRSAIFSPAPVIWLRLKARKKRITKAIRMFIAGPAAITTIRFQTGWL
jgi:hypothetical protein